MTNLAQAVAIGTTQHDALPGTPGQDAKKLVLNPDSQIQAQYQVYVYTFSASVPGGSSVAGFALTEGADTFYTGGLEWNANTDTAVFINFVYLQSTSTYAISVDCDLPYSVGYPAGSPNMQLLCIPFAEYSASYTFFVSFNDGSKHDPQIVITPIGS